MTEKLTKAPVRRKKFKSDFEELQIGRVNRDLLKLIRDDGLDDAQVRMIVNAYYVMQKQRVGFNNRIDAMLRESKKNGKPEPKCLALSYIHDQFLVVEDSVKSMMASYMKQHELFWFFQCTKGLGPVLSAGMCAFFDITRAPTAGHMQSYAGLDPNKKWGKGEKRPWNGTLKTLCWKLGSSFQKVCNREGAYYGRVYLDRKLYEWNKNLNGDYSDQAITKLKTTKISTDTVAYKWYSGQISPKKVQKFRDENGKIPTLPEKVNACRATENDGVKMLPPDHIDTRARRYAVKIFISHLHQVMFMYHYRAMPPVPYAAGILGHAHVEAPPQMPFFPKAILDTVSSERHYPPGSRKPMAELPLSGDYDTDVWDDETLD